MNLNDLFNEEKVRLDPKCWTGKKIGNPKTKMKGGTRVNNCVPAESVEQGVAGGSESDAYGNTGEKHECGSCDGTGIVSYDELAKAAEYDDVCPECGGKGWVRDKELLKKKGVAEDQVNEKSVSQAQFRTMAAAAHNPEFAKKVGISQDVAQEFHGADRKQDYTDLPKKADESKSAPKEKEADYGDDYQAMVARVKKLAGLGPLKTVYDPNKRVYRNIPTAVQPKK